MSLPEKITSFTFSSNTQRVAGRYFFTPFLITIKPAFEPIIVARKPCEGSCIENIIKYNVTVGVSDINFIRGLARTNKLVKVHIELETGMNRTGVLSKYLESFIDDIVKYPTVYVEGIYTHFSSADSDIEYTNKQIDVFSSGVDLIKNKIIEAIPPTVLDIRALPNLNFCFNNIVVAINIV